MSFTDLLRNARSSHVSTVHKFLTNYDPNSDRVFAFVEGDADQAFYRAHIQRYVPDQQKIFIYGCEGKKKVYDAYENVVKRYPQCERVLFFLDKDLDDVVGIQWAADPRIFVTDTYSVENYIIIGEALSRYFKDYVKVRRVEVDLDAVIAEFDAELKQFHRLMLPIMAWIVVMRRAGQRAILNDVDPGELFKVTDTGTVRKPKRSAIAYLNRVTQSGSISSLWKLVRATALELKRMPPKTYVRGKFEAWWFVEFTRRILEGLRRVAEESRGSTRVHSQLNATTFVQLLAAGVDTPPRLDAFLRFHINRGAGAATAKTGDETSGALGFLKSLLKRGQ